MGKIRFSLISILLFSILVVFSSNVNSATQNVSNSSAVVNLNSIPSGADAYINSVYIGTTPTTAYVMPSYTNPVHFYLDKAGFPNYSNFSMYLYDIGPFNITARLNETYTGVLYIYTSPSGANIYVDNIYKGLSPLFVHNVIPGTRQIVATKTGYINSGTYYANVYANQVTNVNLTLQINQTNTSTGSVWMWTPGNSPSKMSYKYLDGVYKGYGHVWVQNVAPGTHTATAHYPGYYNYTTTINVVAGQMTNVSLPLSLTYVYTCTDTDLSTYPTINYDLRGTATRKENNQTIDSYTDSCVFNSNVSKYLLNEWYCTGQSSASIYSTTYDCPYGCMDGACVQAGGDGGEDPVPIIPVKTRLRSPNANDNTIAALAFVAAIALFFLLITKKKKSKVTGIKKSSKKRRI